MTIQVNNSAKGTNKKKATQSKLVSFNNKHIQETLSLGAVCRFIDNAIKHDDNNLPLKEKAFNTCKDQGTFKTIVSLMNDKEKARKKYSAYSVVCILNRLDKKQK